MIEKLLQGQFDKKFLCLVAAMLIVGVPTTISSSWLGAANQVVMNQLDFTPTFIKFFLSSTLAGALAVLVFLYPIEHFLMGNRAIHAWQWLILRIALYMLAGLPVGLCILFGIRLGAESYPPIIESSYFVITLLTLGVIGLFYSLLERSIAEVQKREGQFKREIQELHIQIDEAKRKTMVSEIVNSDTFEEIKEQAKAMRAAYEKGEAAST